MKFEKITGNIRLSGVGSPEKDGSTGGVTVGMGSKNVTLPARGIYVRRVALFGANTATINVSSGNVAVSNAYVSAVKQVESAAIAGTITQSGTLKVTVTRASVATDYYVPILSGDSAAAVGGKCVAYLNVNAPAFTWTTLNASGQKLVATRVLPDLYGYANDSTMNVALANGTCLGFTAAPTSTNTTAGALATGVYVYPPASGDAEGLSVSNFGHAAGVAVEVFSVNSMVGITCAHTNLSALVLKEFCVMSEVESVASNNLVMESSTGWVDAQVAIAWV